MKNERLLDALSSVSPEFIKEAAPGNAPQRRRPSSHTLRRILVFAATLMLILTASIGVLSISAEAEEPLRELPVIMLREDFERLICQKFKEYETEGETHDAIRVRSFFEIQCLSENITQRAKEAMLAFFPITEIADIVNLDVTITEEEYEWLLGQFRSVGFTQNDLIECYERMYALTEKSDSVNKEKILSSLPEIPALTPPAEDDSATDDKDLLQEIPVMMLEEDFDRLIWQRMMETEGIKDTKKPDRLKAYYEFYFYEKRDEKVQQSLLKRQPYLELADVCALDLDITLTDVEKEFILEQLRLIGFTQNDLIECYERLYRLAENSDSENKENILSTLPEIPASSQK